MTLGGDPLILQLSMDLEAAGAVNLRNVVRVDAGFEATLDPPDPLVTDRILDAARNYGLGQVLLGDGCAELIIWTRDPLAEPATPEPPG